VREAEEREQRVVSKRRRIGVWALIVGATVIAFVATLSMWVNRQVLDNSTWRSTSKDLIQDPAVQQSLSVYLVDQLYENVDVAAALQERLPPSFDSLAAPFAAALHEPASTAVAAALRRPRIQQLWISSLGSTHQKLVNVLEDKTGDGITTGNGVVTLQLGALVQRTADELGLPADVAARIPPEAGTIEVMSSSNLSAAQTGVQVVRIFGRWLIVLVLAMYVLAVYLARGNRRIAIRRIGWALVALGLAVLVTRKIVGNYVVDSVTSPAYRGTGHHVWSITTEVLGQIGWASVIYGISLVVAMVLAGGTSYAHATRRTISPVLIERQGVAWGAAGGFLLLLVLWGGTHALRTWWGVALVGILLAAGLAALRRQVIEERDERAPPQESDTQEFDPSTNLALR
jgi:hypothetical protein